VDTRLVGLVAASLSIIMAGANSANAQSMPAGGPFARDDGPKTLFEALIWQIPARKEPHKAEEEDRLEPDRPHFPEASTTVGKGRVMLEGGYTFTRKDSSSVSHGMPESLLRLGMFANWFEFRAGQNIFSERQTGPLGTITTSGAQDSYLGMKFALTEQKGLVPTTAVIPQMTVPTGSRALTAGRALPGVNVDMNWEIVKDFFAIELLIANNHVQDENRGSRHELGTGLTLGFQLSKKLEAFVEWDAFYPSRGIGPSGPRHYAVGGLIYFLNPNLAVDGRIGVGLNDRSNSFLAGVGFAVRR
jgi:hypothetical protein